MLIIIAKIRHKAASANPLRLLLNKLHVRAITEAQHSRFHALMQTHHYLGSAHPVGQVLLYVTTRTNLTGSAW